LPGRLRGEGKEKKEGFPTRTEKIPWFPAEQKEKGKKKKKDEFEEKEGKKWRACGNPCPKPQPSVPSSIGPFGRRGKKNFLGEKDTSQGRLGPAEE